MLLDHTLFITATDTDAGKTLVTAALAAALSAQNVAVTAMKPVASGISPGEPGDADILAQAAGHKPLTYLTFRTPLSPHRALLLEGQSLEGYRDLTSDKLITGILSWIDHAPGLVKLIEGVGGFEVPLLPPPHRLRVSDLAARLGAPVLVVAPDRLGVLSQVLLTVEAIRRRGLRVAGVVLRGMGESALAARYNYDDLCQLLPDVSIRWMPYLKHVSQDTLVHAGQGILIKRA